MPSSRRHHHHVYGVEPDQRVWNEPRFPKANRKLPRQVDKSEPETSATPDPRTLDPKGIRRAVPCFEPAHRSRKLVLRERFAALVQAAGFTPAQRAIAWTLAKAPHEIEIPVTTNPEHLRENTAAASLQLNAAAVIAIDTETFACEDAAAER